MVNASFLRSNHSSYTSLSNEDDPGPSTSDAYAIKLPPVWVDDSEETAANTQRARMKMAELVKAHAKALMPLFGDGKEHQRALEVLTKEITDLLRKSEKRLQKLSGSGSAEDSNIRKNVEGQDGVDIEMNLNENRSRLEDDEFSDVGFNEHQMMKLKQSENLTQERGREITLGTIVDRIDYNIQNVATSVEEAFKQLQKAEQTQKQGGMVMCATVLSILCFIMLVLLILKTVIFVIILLFFRD